MRCPEDDQLAAFLDGCLAPSDLEPLEEHLARCDDCRGVLAVSTMPVAPEDEGHVELDEIVEPSPTLDFRHAFALQWIGRTLGNRWELSRVVGIGGMAVVFAATHRNGHAVAIKMLRPELAADPQAARRFLREGHIANRIDHDGIVRIVDDGVTDEGSPFLVMDLLDGETLKARIDRDGPIPVAEALELGDRLADILSSAHACGVVHRDLKPANVFVTVSGVVKVVDFGIACVRENVEAFATLTQSGLMLGTPGYMAPEQARGHVDRIGPQSDVWSLGATLFTVLTGRSVHEGATAQELLLSAMQPVGDVAKELPAVPSAVSAVLERALAFDPGDRYADAGALRDALRTAKNASRVPALPRRAGRAALVLALAMLASAVLASAVLAGTSRFMTERTEALPAGHAHADPAGAVSSTSGAVPPSASTAAVVATEPSAAIPIVSARPPDDPPRARAAPRELPAVRAHTPEAPRNPLRTRH